MTSLTSLIWRHWPLYYDVTDLSTMTVGTPLWILRVSSPSDTSGDVMNSSIYLLSVVFFVYILLIFLLPFFFLSLCPFLFCYLLFFFISSFPNFLLSLYIFVSLLWCHPLTWYILFFFNMDISNASTLLISLLLRHYLLCYNMTNSATMTNPATITSLTLLLWHH